MNVLLELSSPELLGRVRQLIDGSEHRVVERAVDALVLLIDDAFFDCAERVQRVRASQPAIECIVLATPGRESELPRLTTDFVVRPVRGPELIERIDRVARRRIAAGTRYEDLLALAVEATGDIVEISDPDTVIQYVNPAFERVMGYSAQEAIGCTPAQLMRSDMHSPAYFQQIEQALRDGQVWRGLLISKHRDGRLVYLECTLAPVHNVSGAVSHHIAVKRDVTASRTARAELLQANESLGQARDAALKASQVKSQFLANMSHELRTPLNAIIGYAEMLHDDAQSEIDAGSQGDPASLIGDLGRIRNAGRHLLSLVNDVLDLSKIEAGHAELYLEDFSLRALVEAVFATLMPLVDGRRNALALRLELADDMVRADLVKLRQILVNLISNANKFTQAGRIWVRVRSDRAPEGAQVAGPWYAIDISDTGIGMGDEARAKLFMPFVQADASTTRRFGGTGLGLTISQRFVEMMGGRIEVQSTPDVGSVFTVRLPRQVVAKGAGARPSEQGHTRVLLIDEDRELALGLKPALARAGFALEAVHHGHEGVERARASVPDMIVVDLLLPGMSGVEVMKALAGQPSTARIPVVVLSRLDRPVAGEHDDEATQLKAQRVLAGAVAQLKKPAAAAELIAVLQHHAGRRAARVLVIDADVGFCELLTRGLGAAGHHVDTAQSGAEGLSLARALAQVPELIVLEQGASNVSELSLGESGGEDVEALTVLEQLRADARLQQCLILVTTEVPLAGDALTRVEHLADEVLSKNAYALRELAELVARRLHARLRMQDGVARGDESPYVSERDTQNP